MSTSFYNLGPPTEPIFPNPPIADQIAKEVDERHDEELSRIRAEAFAAGRAAAESERYAEGWMAALRGDETRCGLYEREFYSLSNFSSFTLYHKGLRFDTSEAAYHWEKFPTSNAIQYGIRVAESAHEAFKIAEVHKAERRADWDEIKLDVMRELLRKKTAQHEYVRRKLLETGDREIVEDSWRDDFWGLGENGDGQNWLGKLWMEIRTEYRSLTDTSDRETDGPRGAAGAAEGGCNGV